MAIVIVKPSCNLSTIKDGRGAIFSFVPEAPIMEWTHQFITSDKIRGNHCHPGFDEYILLVNGQGIVVEKDIKTEEERFVHMAKGVCVFVPHNTYHVFRAITDCESVSFLTKRWNDCDTPIIHENIGFGTGDFGDPNSEFYNKQNADNLHV